MSTHFTFTYELNSFNDSQTFRSLKPVIRYGREAYEVENANSRLSTRKKRAKKTGEQIFC